jgi:hypothetical protein
MQLMSMVGRHLYSCQLGEFLIFSFTTNELLPIFGERAVSIFANSLCVVSASNLIYFDKAFGIRAVEVQILSQRL